jgi:hypothetical protein
MTFFSPLAKDRLREHRHRGWLRLVVPFCDWPDVIVRRWSRGLSRDHGGPSWAGGVILACESQPGNKNGSLENEDSGAEGALKLGVNKCAKQLCSQ